MRVRVGSKWVHSVVKGRKICIGMYFAAVESWAEFWKQMPELINLVY